MTNNNLDNLIAKRLHILQETLNWQFKKIDGREIKQNPRNNIVATLIHLAVEHERSIAALIDKKFYGSALALFRSQYEAYVRAVWFRICAKDEDIQDFLNKIQPKKIDKLINDIEKIKPYNTGAISELKEKNWILMNDFVHGGVSQASSRITKDAMIISNHNKQDILTLIGYSVNYGLLAISELAYLMEDGNLAKKIAKKSVSVNKKLK